MAEIGYHLRPIAKGILGQPSKILEEALEALDAAEQDSRIMELVELSDLFGAWRACWPETTWPQASDNPPLCALSRGPSALVGAAQAAVEAHALGIDPRPSLAHVFWVLRASVADRFPGFSLRDLEQMADITARAFRVGRRT